MGPPTTRLEALLGAVGDNGCTWTCKMAKIMDLMLPIVSVLRYWANILGSFGGPGSTWRPTVGTIYLVRLRQSFRSLLAHRKPFCSTDIRDYGSRTKISQPRQIHQGTFGASSWVHAQSREMGCRGFCRFTWMPTTVRSWPNVWDDEAW